MADLLDSILTLADKGTVEQRSAVLIVLGALKLHNARVLKSIAAALDQPNPILKDYALRYLEETQPKSAIPAVIRLLEESDREINDRAVRFLINTSDAAVEPLLKRLPAAPRP